MKYVYDKIGVGYAVTRQSDPRVQARIEEALDGCESIANVGAGTGSYEPVGRSVVAVEPSPAMLRQRPAGSAPAIRGSAERLPLEDDSVDAALAVLTVHHWREPRRGLAEMRRVARQRVVVLTWDPDLFEEAFWLVRDYLPGLRAIDRSRALAISELSDGMGATEILPVPIPHDCLDGFFGAFWRRPEAYLDPRIRAAISAFAQSPADQQHEGLARLAGDLESGAWRERYRDLVGRAELDLGYRLLVAPLSGAA